VTSSNNMNIDMLKQLQRLVEQGGPPEAHRVSAIASLDDAINDELFTRRLRTLTIAPDAGDSAAAAAGQLTDAIARERIRTRRLHIVAAAAAVFVVTVSLAAVSLFVRTQPVTALGSIADVVATLSPDEFGDTQLIRHTREERLIVSVFDETAIPALQPVTRLDRIDTDGRIGRTETLGEPRLLNPQDAPFLDDVRGELAAGTTITTIFEAPGSDDALILSDSVKTFSGRMRNQYDRWGDAAVPYEAYAIDRITSIYVATVPTPQQRAAILTFINALPTITQTQNGDGATAAYEYVGADGRELRELRFNSVGWLTKASLTLLDGSEAERTPPSTQSTIRLTAPIAAHK